MTCSPDGFSGVDGGIAVIGVGLDINVQSGDQAVEFVQLILGEGLGGEEIDGPRMRILEQGVEHRDVVAERLPRGGGSDDDDILAPLGGLDRRGLMGKESLDTSRLEHVDEARIDAGREVGERSLPGRRDLPGGDLPHEVWGILHLGEDLA